MVPNAETAAALMFTFSRITLLYIYLIKNDGF